MTSQGTARGRFGRAIRDRHLRRAEMAAREMGELSLPDALAFCLLLAEFDPDRWPRAIARWHARFVLEAPGISAGESLLVLAAAQALDGPAHDVAAKTLTHLAHKFGLSNAVQSLR